MLMLRICGASALLCASGCSKTTLVDDGSPMRIGRAKGTLYVRIDGEWRETEAVEIPSGWYIVPPRFVE
jgi:hypothetical protein